MIKDVLFVTIGGLALFMFGMNLMSEGLKKVAGTRLRAILESMTRRRIVGFLVGAGITALIQSSSAATVMLVGFVNAGLMTLQQAIAVIIGTNVGTTATAWLVSISGLEAFKITAYALPAIGIGFGLQCFAKKRLIKDIGQIMLGFGILFVGIDFMKDAFAGLEQSAAVQNLFLQTAHTPLFAILIGTIITMLIQSSSASVASIQLLAAGGAFGGNWGLALSVAIPFILGCNIGTTITAQIAALGTNLNARRTAWTHTLFNTLSAFICFWLIGSIAEIVKIVMPWELGAVSIAAAIAVAHTIINIIGTVVFLPLTGLLEKAAIMLIREKPGEEDIEVVVLEKHLLDTPVIAMQQAKREMVRMAKTAKKTMLLAIDGIIDNDAKKLEKVLKNEDFIDSFQLEITSYLSELSRRHLSHELSVKLPVFLHTVNDLERIGDHAVNIVELAERKTDKKLSFSDSAQEEARRLREETVQMFDAIITALENDNKDAAQSALKNETNLNQMQLSFRRSHVRRIADGKCTPLSGLIFIDLVDNVEKVGDHLTNIAQAAIGGLQWEGIEPAFDKLP